MSEAAARGEFKLGWALAAAVALHALVLLLSLVVPVFEFVRDTPPAEERITFTLVDPSAEDAERDSAPPTPSVPTPKTDRREPAPEPPSLATAESIEAPPERAELDDAAGAAPLIDEPSSREASPPRAVPDAAPSPDTRPQSESVELGSGEVDEPSDDRPRAGSLKGALRDFRSAVRSAPRTPPSAAPARPPSNVFVPDMSQVPVSGSQLGELTFESRDYDWSDYGRQIYMAIWRAWHRRLNASTDEFERWAHETGNWYLEHQSGVRFTIERSGRVVGIEVERPGGCGPLDRSAADALAEVVLPPLPADFPRDREVVHARFVISGEVRAMRPVLRRMKAMGLF